MLFKPKKKYGEREGKVINHNRVLHAEIQESEISVQPTCNAILEESGAGFYHSCVFYETVGTQTDEPMDVSEEKRQELYFVVYICLIFIFSMLHDIKIHVQEKETSQLRYLMEHSCFDINEFKENPEDILFFYRFFRLSDYDVVL